MEYAREKSDRIAKRDGTYVKRKKQKTMHAFTETSDYSAELPPAAKKQRTTTSPSLSSSSPQQPPSHILFMQDLPPECNKMMLEMLFRQYTGYKEVRVPREGLAFVEFDDEPHATLALQGLNGFKLTTNDTLNLTYGKS